MADREVEDRYEKLRAWRKARAEGRKVEVQVIAPNAVLMAVARSAPRTLDELSRVEGMDPFRVQQYGPEMLAAYHWTFDSGLNVAMAFGVAKHMATSQTSSYGESNDTDANGYFRFGYAF